MYHESNDPILHVYDGRFRYLDTIFMFMFKVECKLVQHLKV